MTKTIEEIREEIKSKILAYNSDPYMTEDDCLNELLSIEVGGEVKIAHENLKETFCSGEPYYHTEYKGMVTSNLTRPRTLRDLIEKGIKNHE
jgi:hypothetical protein